MFRHFMCHAKSWIRDTVCVLAVFVLFIDEALRSMKWLYCMVYFQSVSILSLLGLIHCKDVKCVDRAQGLLDKNTPHFCLIWWPHQLFSLWKTTFWNSLETCTHQHFTPAKVITVTSEKKLGGSITLPFLFGFCSSSALKF